MMNHPFEQAIQKHDNHYYFDLNLVAKEKLDELPYCIRVLLENVVRNCNGVEVTVADVNKVLLWSPGTCGHTEIPYKPARVLLQDFTGVPCGVDLASMRSTMTRLKRNPKLVNPLVPVDLVIDHSVAVDASGNEAALNANEALEFERNKERFTFLKWCQQNFRNFTVVPPGNGICHQINLEYLARGVMVNPETKFLYPDTCVGTDSHTTMIAGLGILGWGVGGIEAEAVMMGQPIYMLLPAVVAVEIIGESIPAGCTATDLVLKLAQLLREKKVVGKIVEFTGAGCQQLSIEDRATISNMSPEFGCTTAFFPPDKKTLEYLLATGRDSVRVEMMEKYWTSNHLFRTPASYENDPDLVKYSEILRLDLSTLEPSIAGPKRPHDWNRLSDLCRDFPKQLGAPPGFRGFGVTPEDRGASVDIELAIDSKTGLLVPQCDEENAPPGVNVKKVACTIRHGSVVLAAITSCTNTSNPSVVIAAGLVCRKAREFGLVAKPWVKCSLSPGSQVVQQYLQNGGLYEDMKSVGFFVTGFGCQSCIGNSGDLYKEVIEAVTLKDLVVAAVLSGNRNFEGRVNPNTRANYLASPPLVILYALAGRIDVDWAKEPVGFSATHGDVFLKDLWPANAEIQAYMRAQIRPQLFTEVYTTILDNNKRWNALTIPASEEYEWDALSTYINNPSFFDSLEIDSLPERKPVSDACCLLLLGDSITTDHISPAGKIAAQSPAAAWLTARGVEPKFFNSYGSRRGHDAVMERGTFANIRLVNLMAAGGRAGPLAVHVPSREEGSVYEIAKRYKRENRALIIIAGDEYGAGSSRDWAAKGPFLLGVSVVIAKSFERIHRSNLVGMGILPLQFPDDVGAATLGLTGFETFDVDITTAGVQNEVLLQFTTAAGTTTAIKTRSRIDTPIELEYYKHGGILNYVLRKMAKNDRQANPTTTTTTTTTTVPVAATR